MAEQNPHLYYCKVCGKQITRRTPGPKIYCSDNCRPNVPAYKKDPDRRPEPSSYKPAVKRAEPTSREVRYTCADCHGQFIYTRAGGVGGPERRLCDICRRNRQVNLEEMREFYTFIESDDRPSRYSWYDDGSDEQAMLDELRRTGYIQGHRPEQPVTGEIKFLANLVRRQIQEEERQAARQRAREEANAELGA